MPYLSGAARFRGMAEAGCCALGFLAISGRRYPPDGVGKIVRDDERAARIDRHPYRPAPGPGVLAEEAGDEIDRLAVRAAIAERHEDDLETDRRVTVPAAVLADEHALGELVPHRRRGEGEAERGDMRAQGVIRLDRCGNLLRILRPHPGIHVLAPVAVRPAVERAFLDRGEVI